MGWTGTESPLRPAPESSGAEQGTQEGLPAGATGGVHGGLPSPGRRPDSEGQWAPGRREQLSPAPPLPTLIKDEPAAVPTAGLEEEDRGDRHTPSQPCAQAWNRSIAELLCGLTLPLSFLVAHVAPGYRLPSPATFCDAALPLLREAVGE